MSICLFRVYLCFCATVTELRVATETLKPANPKIFTIWPSTKILVNAILQQESLSIFRATQAL